MTSALLGDVFNHLVLPPKVPGKRDSDIEGVQDNILNRAIKACDVLGKSLGDEHAETWATVRSSFRTCQAVNRGRLDRGTLQKTFGSLQHDDLLILYIVEQNAALLVRRHIIDDAELVVFEVFEASPSSTNVLAAEDALIWDFPGRAVQLSLEEFQKKSFQQSLSAFLEHASIETLERFQAHSAKANVSILEVRDTPNPALITQMLMSLLEAVGSPIEVPMFRKRVRDEVNIENAEYPWRRSPFWLILRVTIQRQLGLLLGNAAGRACYKFFMCTLLNLLLEECVGQLAPELTMTLSAKICRRLAKLELEKSQNHDAADVYNKYLESLSPLFKDSTEKAKKQIDQAWSHFKTTVMRPVPRLPRYADQHALQLSLPNSGRYLTNILALSLPTARVHLSMTASPVIDGTLQQVTKFTDHYFTLAWLDEKIKNDCNQSSDPAQDCISACVHFAGLITSTFVKVGAAYNSNPEQMSIYILGLFDLWIKMDEHATNAAPLLFKFAPAFKPELLDVLHLNSYANMKRLQRIQNYLQERHEKCQFKDKTIFSNPDNECFALHYVRQSDTLQRLQQDIEDASARSRDSKESEWERACDEYDDLSQKISNGTCVCTLKEDGTRDVRGCKKCFRWRSRNRMKITIHEDFLPSKDAEKAAVVMELGCPSFLTNYRNATFKIISNLAHPAKPKSLRPPNMLLKEYSQLQNYRKSSMNGVSLASAKKSWLQTHYKEPKMKASLSTVLLPLALEVEYYDSNSQVWLKDLNQKLTFEHYCRVHIPRCLQVASNSLKGDGPSSYEIIASQTRCPAETSVHEFTSYQRLLAGNVRRWLTMLVELGASNLNFNAEDTMHIFNHLIAQAGPSQDLNEVLRSCHFVFKDRTFCRRLAEQIGSRLRNIATNWRETYCMEILISLCLRLHTLSTGQDREAARNLLKIARDATLQWVYRLRDEVRCATEADAAERAANYGFWAALLCRRTFYIFSATLESLSAVDLCSFVQASIALQENLVVDLEKLPSTLRNMLVRDTKMSYRLRQLIQESIENYPESLAKAINNTWCDPDNSMGRTFSTWQVLPSPDDRWVVSQISITINHQVLYQLVHYNFVEGHLLVDHKPLGRLPLDIRDSEDVKELFGNQHLLTYPSAMSGMSHFLAAHVYNNEVHFGLRGGQVVIRAVNKDGLFEYIPRRVFKGTNTFDLPLALIQGCFHWLNLNTNSLEIRREPAIWVTRQRDWVLNLATLQAKRGQSTLVDPNSIVNKRIADIFNLFEEPERMTIYQPERGPLCVEMRHLELSFFVNRDKLLQCRELHAEIDPDQDAGTLYGFQSKIVLRDIADPGRRSIIFPIGTYSWFRRGMHVSVRTTMGVSTGYGRFQIDDTLGRLSCPPEPLLLFSKVYLHALTSFTLPDPLSGRTGTEEAIHSLRSGSCQPWSPIPQVASLLKAISNLSPQREYYPKELMRLQTVKWDDRLTATIQHESYASLAHQILTKSNRLQAFNTDKSGATETVIERLSYLQNRALKRRLLYEGDATNPGSESNKIDAEYVPRDRHIDLSQAANVYQVVKLVRESSSRAPLSKNVAAILESWHWIGGFGNTELGSEGISGCLSEMMENKIADQWGTLVNLCRNHDPRDPYSITFRLALLSFSTKPDMDAIRLLAAYCCVNELKVLETPEDPAFAEFKLNGSPKFDRFLAHITECFVQLEPQSGKSRQEQERRIEKHRIQCESDARRLAYHLLEQWPNLQLSAEAFNSTLVDKEQAVEKLLPEWQRLHGNMRLSTYVTRTQEILDRYKGPKDDSIPQAWNEHSVPFHVADRGILVPAISALLLKCASPPSEHFVRGKALSREIPGSENAFKRENATIEEVPGCKGNIELGKILDVFAKSRDILRQQYGNDLKKSLYALEKTDSQSRLHKILPDVQIIKEDIKKTRVAIEHEFNRIQSSFSTTDGHFQWLRLGGLLPCKTPVALLEQLRSSSNHRYGSNIRDSLCSYGILITRLQRLLRVKLYQLKGDYPKALEEWENAGHENWTPADSPDWLLLEIESDILIRSEQIDVARAIISPASGSNSVLQLNMGKGKTSCIVPMAMATLANKKQLSRLIVPKALLHQTAQTIQSRLGGLVGREIRHVPFSRRTPTTPDMLELYTSHHRDIINCCGIILTTPEHILSYKLSGLQRLADFKLAESTKMVMFQSWLTKYCRDVLDESDFTLAVKTQLIYPSGPQMSVDGHPHRWEVAQILLSLVEDHVLHLQRDFPKSIEVFKRPAGYPMIHFLRTDVEDALIQRIIGDICDGRISFLRLLDPTATVAKRHIRHLLSDEKLNQELLEQTSTLFTDNTSARKNILLVRGLLSNRVLLLCLKKRWNVQYGLHPGRSPIAVPFEAKGIPSEQAEFGHPDVSILFTCLAFYYTGLTLAQFREGLQHVLKSDDPAAEYDRWTNAAETLPEALHHWNAVNGDDQGQVEELWRHLRLNRNVLDHYMNNYVFPLHAKQFGIKLQASGWDLPLFLRPRPGKEISKAKTTGFSGTNDNKMMLPLNIKQDDLPSLQQTNAEVLTYLLQDRNRNYALASRNGKRHTEPELLSTLKSMKIRILIDGGAYILEMNNKTLAQKWLEIDTEAKASVYFSNDNRARVLYRGGKDVPLLATPFAEDFEGCLVYIDEAHTRGIDLKLPLMARGALTLALGQTKDHTMQAAMRLRQLGTTQSITFFAPPEVHQSILDVWKAYNGNAIEPYHVNSAHVLLWLLEQTCRTNEQLHSLYIAQGTDFCRRMNARWENADFLTNSDQRKAYLSVLQEPECQTLEQLYGGAKETRPSTTTEISSTALKSFMEILAEQRRTSNGRIDNAHSSMLEEVEQEREVEFQVEQVRQTQKQTHYKALKFSTLHPTISQFASTGRLIDGKGYEHMFDALGKTTLGKKFNIRHTPSQLFVSNEFMRTIDLGKQKCPSDNFLRPVEWIIWSPATKTALIVISEEAELLIPILRAVKQPSAHLIAYAPPVTKNMLHFNGLLYYVLPQLPEGCVIPDWLPIELGIFSGRLYFEFSEYSLLTKYLKACEKQEVGISIDFLVEWLTFCRKSQDIMHTPMGYICQGRPLHESHPFFTSRIQDPVVATTTSPVSGSTGSSDVEKPEYEDDEGDYEDYEVD